MKKLLYQIVIVLLLGSFLLSSIVSTPVFADIIPGLTPPDPCNIGANSMYVNKNFADQMNANDTGTYEISFILPSTHTQYPATQNANWRLIGIHEQSAEKLQSDEEVARIEPVSVNGDTVIFRLSSQNTDNNRWFVNEGGDNNSIRVELWSSAGGSDFKCTAFKYTVLPYKENLSCTVTLSQQNSDGEYKSGCFDRRPVRVDITNMLFNGNEPYNGSATLEVVPQAGSALISEDITVFNGTFSLTGGGTPDDDDVIHARVKVDGKTICESEAHPVDPNCTDEQRDSDGNSFAVVDFDICLQIPPGPARTNCMNCLPGVWTALGCISTQPDDAFGTLIGIGLSIAGGVALLMILVAGFKFSTSQGDPKKTGDAKELLLSAVIGLFFIIFSVTILQFIGVTIFHIPGFGGA